MDTTFRKKERIAKDICTFWFGKPSGFSYTAGQFIELTLTQIEVASDSKRWFTLSSSPTESALSITTNCDPKSPFKKILMNLKENDTVHISQPLGDFVLPKMSSIPIVLIGGGLGCTPFRSMLITDRVTRKRDLQLYISFHTPDEAIFTDVFKALIPGYSPHIGRRVRVDSVLKNVNAPSQTYFYIAGSEEMVTDIRGQLISNNIPSKHIFSDNFIGYKYAE